MFTVEELAQVFLTRGRTPQLNGVINELLKLGVLCRVQDIKSKAQLGGEKRGFFKNWLGKAKGIWKTEDPRIIIKERLEWIVKFLSTGLAEEDREILVQDGLITMLSEQWSLTEEEANIVLDYLCAEGIAEITLTQLSTGKFPVVKFRFQRPSFEEILSKAKLSLSDLARQVSHTISHLKTQKELMTQNMGDMLENNEIATARVFFNRERNTSQRIQQLSTLFTAIADLSTCLQSCDSLESLLTNFQSNQTEIVVLEELLDYQISHLRDKYQPLSSETLPNDEFDPEFESILLTL